MDMISNRPYLLRAFYQWIVDSGCTPIVVVDAEHPRCKIPQEFAEDGEMVFNISPMAIRDLQITNEKLDFKASFSGVIYFISAPINGVLSIYAEENGEGIFFESDDTPEITALAASRLTSISNTGEEALRQSPPDAGSEKMESAKGGGKPFLKLIE
ncbi:MAG TPA: ClpXP protease specificity-enhancing factor [Gammaproteobacteria bacterium]|nr:ClpXP protease specificity-enhancing factor [Gammaproteobacteria bacterium]